MRATPLSSRSVAGIRDALLSHGWEGVSAREAAEGILPAAVHLHGVSPDALEALVRVAGRLGLEVVTGVEWAILSGARSRLTSFARPWQLPPELADVAAAVAAALPAEVPDTWGIRGTTIDLRSPLVLGILNVTPDSFSDGGRFDTVERAVDHARALVAAGARMLDVGGQSTRPGVGVELSVEEEIRRVLPVVEALRATLPEVPLSVDTVRADVAAAALEAGAAVVNDVSGFRLDPHLAQVVASAGAGVILMHSRGSVTDMATFAYAQYVDLIGDVIVELASGLERAREAGVREDRIVLDPGLGFGKTADQNLQLVRELSALRCLGRPLLVGPSRKRFLGAATGRPVEDRDRATAAACALAWGGGARIFRLHDPAAAKDALAVAEAIDPLPATDD